MNQVVFTLIMLLFGVLVGVRAGRYYVAGRRRASSITMVVGISTILVLGALNAVRALS